MYEVRISRSIAYGDLSAKTRIPLNDARGRVLLITTDKATRGGLECSAAVMTPTADGQSETHEFGAPGDFRKRIGIEPGKRATMKALQTFHLEQSAKFADVVQEALAFYAAREAARIGEINACAEG